MDDAGGNIANTVGSTEITAYGISSVILVHNVPFVDKRCHSWLLSTGNW